MPVAISGSEPSCPSTVSKSNEPKCRNITNSPSISSTSPTRVVMNAFFAARAASGRSDQNPINR